MIPSAVPRNVARVLPSRAAASTQTNRAGTLSRRDVLQFTQNAGIIGFVIGVRFGFVRFFILQIGRGISG